METIRAGENTMYIDYTFNASNTINQTTGFTLKFPTPTLNIKANNACISIAKLAYVNIDKGMLAENLPLVYVQTSLPTSSCINAISSDPKSVTYSDTVMFDTINDVAHMYNNYSTNKVLCANPLSNI